MRSTSKQKLQFKSETIMVLSVNQLEHVQSGASVTTVTTTVTSSAWCIRGTLIATRSSQGCAKGIGEGIARTPDNIRKGNEWVRDKVTVSF